MSPHATSAPPVAPVLDGRVAIITGASAGIGRAAAHLFAAAGARLVLGARRREPLEALVDALGPARAACVPGDAADPAWAGALVEQALTRFGGLDVGFVNAGTLGPMGPTPEIDPADWRGAMAVNLDGSFFAARAMLPAMVGRGGGSLIFTSTFVGHTVGFPGMATYAAGKAGLLGLTRALAAEYGGRGVRVNALLPGGTDTAMGRAVADSPEALAHVRGLHALQRIARPEEIAHSALYLASPASSFTTGAALLVDGGVSIHRS